MDNVSAPERHVAAQKLGLHEQYLYQFLARHRVAPSERCPGIERELYPKVTVDQLRPDVRWVRVPDPTWPHPDGRPCIDVAAPKTVEVRDAA